MSSFESFAVARRAFGVAGVAGIVVVGAASCGGQAENESGGSTTGAGASAAGHGGMAGMQGSGGAMMEQMQAHIRMMETANADSMRAMLPMHRQMAGNMLSDMNRQMRQMNTAADARWTALSDSVRQDLVRLPELGAAELRTFMPGHRGRVTRLMEMHQSIIAGMSR